MLGLALARQALDQRVVVGVIEERDRQPRPARRAAERRVHDAVHVRQPPVIGPAHQQVADVHDEALRRRGDIDPLAGARQDLQPAGDVLAGQDREPAIVGVGARPELPRNRRHRLRRIVVEAHRPDRAIDLVVEEGLVDPQRERGQPHEEHDELVHRAVVRGRRPGESGGDGRPDIGSEVPASQRARVVGVAGGIDGADVEELLEIGRRRGVIGPGQSLAPDRVIAAVRARDGCRAASLSASGRAKNACALERRSSTTRAGTPWPLIAKKPISRQASSIRAATARRSARPPWRAGVRSISGTSFIAPPSGTVPRGRGEATGSRRPSRRRRRASGRS